MGENQVKAIRYWGEEQRRGLGGGVSEESVDWYKYEHPLSFAVGCSLGEQGDMGPQ